MRRATPIELSDDARRQLEQLARSRTASVRLAERAAIVLHAADGLENQQIAAVMNISRQKAARWRVRYAAHGLAGIEKDAPRPGRKRRISAKQRAIVVHMTLYETPDGHTHWSRSTMAKATGLSDSTIGRIWREHGLKPHQVRTFKLSNDPQFVEKLNDIIGLYVSPPEHAIVLSCDEKSQIQALDRTQPSLPMKPGRNGTMTHDYKRNGTTCLFAALNVLEGTVIGSCYPRHRNVEFLKFLRQIDRETPLGLDLHLVLDNYGTHNHDHVHQWLRKHPRFHLHFTPTSSSWLNLVERRFGEITRKRIRRGVFKSVPQLIEAIQDFIRVNNQNPKPFVWTKKVDQILEKVSRCKAVIVTPH